MSNVTRIKRMAFGVFLLTAGTFSTSPGALRSHLSLLRLYPAVRPIGMAPATRGRATADSTSVQDLTVNAC